MQPTQIQQTQQSVASNQNHIKQEPIHQKPSNLVTAQRVAEILKAAGETFCRLGECTMMLDQSANPNKTKVFHKLLRGYHKIKHFACHRDFLVYEIPRIKHTQNASYPGIRHLK